jgi:transcriptional antiterminator RfaH
MTNAALMSDVLSLRTDIWYLVYAKPRQEEVARFNLQQQGFETYLPLYKKFKKTEQGPVSVFEPMFPRYLFFRPTSGGQSLSTVRSTRGVTTLVRFGFEPAVVADALIERIRQLEQERNAATLQQTSDVRAGQKVRLKHTALGDVEGLVQSVSSKRVAVLLEILGRPAVVQVEYFQVEPTDA